MFGKLDGTENQVLDLVNKIDMQKGLELNSCTERLERTLEKSGIAVCQWSGDFDSINANHQFYNNLLLPIGANREQIKQSINESLYAEDLMRLKEELLKLQQLSGSNTLVNEYRQRTNGQTRWYRFGLTVENKADQSHYFFISWNITSEKELCKSLSHRETVLREQNAKLSSLVVELEAKTANSNKNNSQEGLNLSECNAYAWSWDIAEGLFEINLPSLKDAASVRPGVYTFDKIIEKVFPDDVQKIQMEPNINEVYAKDEYFSIELRLDHDGSGYTWFEFRGSIIDADAEGSPLLMRGLFLNIQKRKNKEFALMHEMEQLRQVDKNRSALLANLAQEICTPLHAIVEFSDLLTNIKNDEERSKYLDIVKNNNETLLRLIDRIMTQTEIERQKEELKKDTVCLWEYLVELHQVYSMKIASDVKLMFTNPYDSGRVIIDKDKFGEAIGILINNAIQYTQSGYISYGFEFENDKLIFTLSDTGEGIESEKLKTIFLPYEKSDLLLPSKGVSLSVCKSLINRMGGEIYVESQPNVGTTFTIILPLVMDKPEAMVVEELEVKEQKPVQIVKNDKQLPVILVAEDTLYSFLMLKTLLEDRFKVIHAENGAHAIELFRETNPVFVFMDIKMPVMDGIEATRRIREISKEVPIVVLTAYAVRSLRKDAAEAGCTDMLTKPTSTKQINATIRKYLKKDN